MERYKRFSECALPLATRVANNVLQQVGVAPSSVGKMVLVTSTGVTTGVRVHKHLSYVLVSQSVSQSIGIFAVLLMRGYHRGKFSKRLSYVVVNQSSGSQVSRGIFAVLLMRIHGGPAHTLRLV